jgi:hypothetical protein
VTLAVMPDVLAMARMPTEVVVLHEEFQLR